MFEPCLTDSQGGAGARSVGFRTLVKETFKGLLDHCHRSDSIADKNIDDVNRMFKLSMLFRFKTFSRGNLTQYSLSERRATDVP